MEHIRTFERRAGVDLYYGKDCNLHPESGEGRVGVCGMDKTFSLEKIISIAYQMPEKPNIIIKAGPDAKWYLKKCPTEEIEVEIEKNKWRDSNRCIMYVIEWLPLPL
jgi:hypothetical protein